MGYKPHGYSRDAIRRDKAYRCLIAIGYTYPLLFVSPNMGTAASKLTTSSKTEVISEKQVFREVNTVESLISDKAPEVGSALSVDVLDRWSSAFEQVSLPFYYVQDVDARTLLLHFPDWYCQTLTPLDHSSVDQH